MPLFDPLPGTWHARDIFLVIPLRRCYFSDHAFGILFWAHLESLLLGEDICDHFPNVFARNDRIAKGRVHRGRAFLGPDGLCIVIRGEVYNGGDRTLGVSPLSIAQILTHPNYGPWFLNLCCRDRRRFDSDHHRGIMNGTIRAPKVPRQIASSSSSGPSASGRVGNFAKNSATKKKSSKKTSATSATTTKIDALTEPRGTISPINHDSGMQDTDTDHGTLFVPED
ncbi:hypothetical protein M7I_0098 [Glarea lozoyensis 74030]|nr:hypothetical protein M7I_0098 [Glarea lozoyensis 74030]